MKHKKRITAVLLSAVLAVTMIPAAALGAVRYMPDVTSAMSKASYWSSKVAEPQRVLATGEEISALNKEIYKTSKETRDMAAWSKTEFDARQTVKDLLANAESDADYLWGPSCEAYYHRDGSKAASKDEMFAGPIALCKDPDVDLDAQGTDMQPYKYAVCTTRTSLLCYPTDEAFQDDPDDPDFDYNYLTQVKVNEPVLLRTKSTPLPDGRFYYSALTECGSGWIAADCVAICSDKAQWLDAWNYPSEQLLVVLDDKVWTEESNSQPETAKRKLPMGTRLQLATEEEAQGQIGGRTAHNNHAVWMPVRRADGTYEKQLALIGENRKVSEGYPELTVENVMSVALNQLGDVYGWGSMLGTDDCSGYYRDVFSCFGLDLPRSTNRYNGVLKTYDLTKMTDTEKAAFIKTLPPGANLTFSGHEMLYLGHEGDKLYVISSVYSLRLPGNNFNTVTKGTHINTLDVLRRDNQTWLHHMKEASIPFYGAEHPDYKENVTPAPEPKPEPKPAPQIRKSNPMTAAGKTVTLKGKSLKKKSRTITRAKALSVKKAKGQLTYTLKGVTKKKYQKYFRVDASSGTIHVRKKLKKGTYQLTIHITAEGTKSYYPGTKTAKVKVKVV